jgi:hypothetical protein
MPVFDKDLMKGISEEINALSDQEKAARARQLQQLLDAELQRRKGGPAAKPAKARSGLGAFFRKLFG